LLEPHHVIDIMAQGTASGLAPDLAMASRQIGGDVKLDTGKYLIRLFCTPTSTATPQSHPTEWANFCHYAGFDILSARDVFLGSRQLTRAEWREFWTSERINEKGINVDVKMVSHAAKLAEEDGRRSRVELPKLTAGCVETVNQVAKISAWLLGELPATGRDILLKTEEEVDEDGVITKPAKFSLRRPQVEKLIAYCKATPGLDLQQRVLELRLYGGSKSSAKFKKIMQQHVDGKLFGMFVFNGAPQTGRFSSKGIQYQNLARSCLAYEYEAIEAILNGCSYDELAALGDDSPVARKLALLVRPGFIAPPGQSFIWSDASQIEARVLPYLAGTEDAQQYLEGFRLVDEDPTQPDLYVRTAAGISNLSIDMIDKPLRQRGKVTILACGFAGGVGALQSMAAGMGMYLSDEEAKRLVDAWRADNDWAVVFWNRLWDAAEQAIHYPGVLQRAGRSRISYIVLNGDLLAILPSGRVLTYRNIKYDTVAELDDDDQPTGKMVVKLRYSRGYNRVAIWRGTLVENVVQAFAADVLRGTMRRLDEQGFDIRAHVHDEILLLVDDSDIDRVKAELSRVMRQGFSWTEGLPLMSQETVCTYYTKTLDD
jgi:DNA polymerase